MTHASMPCSFNAANAEAAAPNSCLISRPAAPVPHETQSIPNLGCFDRGATMTGYHREGRSTTAEIEFRSLTHSHVAMPSTWLSTALSTQLYLRDCLKIHCDSLLYKSTRDVETSENPNVHTPQTRVRLGACGVQSLRSSHPFRRLHCTFPKISAQSRSMSTTTQPRAGASSRPRDSFPMCDARSYAHSRAASV